jgi:hypothetical protein
MKPKKTSKPVPKITSTTIDADVLARINAKIAKAHEQTDSPYVYKRPMPIVKPFITHECEPER